MLNIQVRSPRGTCLPFFLAYQLQILVVPSNVPSKLTPRKDTILSHASPPLMDSSFPDSLSLTHPATLVGLLHCHHIIIVMWRSTLTLPPENRACLSSESFTRPPPPLCIRNFLTKSNSTSSSLPPQAPPGPPTHPHTIPIQLLPPTQYFRVYRGASGRLTRSLLTMVEKGEE